MQSTLTVGMSVGGPFFLVVQVTYNRTGHNTLGVAVAHLGLLTAGLGVACFVFLFWSCLRQVRVLHALCFCFVFAYSRSGCCMLCVFVLVLLTTGQGVACFVLLFCACLRQVWVLHAFCFCFVLAYDRPGCCRLCVFVERLFTTDLGVAAFVFL